MEHRVLIGLTLLATSQARAEPITFRDAVARALERTPAARASEATVARASSQVEQTRASSLPSLSLGLSHVWFESVTTDGAWAKTRLSSTLGAAVLSVPIIEPRAWAHWAEAKEEVEVAEQARDEVRRRVVLTAGRAWVAVRSQEHILEARQEALRTAQAHVSYTHGRFEGGAANQLDALRAERELATVQALVEQSEAGVTKAREALGFALGEPQAVEVTQGSLEELVAQDWALGEARPDVERQHLATAAAHQEVRDGYTDYLPSVSVEGQAFAQDVPTPTLPVSGIGWLAQVMVRLPLYDGGRRYGQQHEREAKLREAQARLDEISLLAHAEARVGADAHAHARLALEHARAAAELSRKALELTRRRYQSGVGTDLDVIDALREARDADISVALADDQLNLSALDVLAASGRLF
jgi:outer membrane protein TolC